MINRVFWPLLLLGLLGPLLSRALAQGGPQPQNLSATPSAQERVHIQLEKPALPANLPLTLAKAIELALERNPLLTVEKIRLEQARERIEVEKGNYDPLFQLRNALSRRDNVVASRFYPTGLYVDEERSHGLSLEAKTYTGGRFSLGVDYKRLESSSNVQTLSPQYSANFAFTFTHALLRDFGWGVNTARIRIAEKGESIAEANVAQRVSQLVQQVEESYWNLVFLRRDLEIKRTSLEIAKKLLQRSEDLFRAGRVAAVSVTEGRAGVAAREEAILTADAAVKKSEDRLKLLLYANLAEVEVLPLDPFDEAPAVYDIAQSLERALKSRSDIQAVEQEVQQKEIEVKFAKNQTLPRLDFTAQYGMAGLSGRPNKTPANPLVRNIFGELVPCGSPSAPACEPAGANVEGSIFQYKTGPADAFNRFFSRHPFDNWLVELRLQIPLWNRAAQAQLSDANLRLAEARIRLRILREQIESELRDSIRDALTARQRIEATRQSVKWVEEQLDGALKKFEAGLSTSYDLLLVLDDLDRAKTHEARAVMDYAVAQTKVRLAEGSVLARYNIEIKKTPRYRFD